MIKKSQILVTLKKSNLHYFLLVLILMISTQFTAFGVNLRGLSDEQNKHVIILEPKAPKQGDTLSVKIQIIESDSGKPKVFFDKTKYEAFKINDNFYRAFVPLEANLSPGIHKLDIHYDNKASYVDVNLGKTNYALEHLVLSKTASSLMVSRVERIKVGEALSIKSDKKLWTGPFVYPSKAKKSTPYGKKRTFNGSLDPSYFHKGLDFAGKTGDPIYATEDGKVILTGYNSNGFNVNGSCIFLDHGHGIVSAYLHLSSILVKEGDFIKKGQLIGKTGSTGIATGPHLHWGVYASGKPIDPEWWVSMAIE